MKLRINVTVDIDRSELEEGQSGSDLAHEIQDSLEMFFHDFSVVSGVDMISVKVSE